MPNPVQILKQGAISPYDQFRQPLRSSISAVMVNSSRHGSATTTMPTAVKLLNLSRLLTGWATVSITIKVMVQ